MLELIVENCSNLINSLVTFVIISYNRSKVDNEILRNFFSL